GNGLEYGYIFAPLYGCDGGQRGAGADEAHLLTVEITDNLVERGRIALRIAVDDGYRSLGFTIAAIGQGIHKTLACLRNGRIFKCFDEADNRNTFLFLWRLAAYGKNRQEKNGEQITSAVHNSKLNENV